jgi:hypothetical protein
MSAFEMWFHRNGMNEYKRQGESNFCLAVKNERVHGGDAGQSFQTPISSVNSFVVFT